ncbi:MAG TPA: sigma 54-interacting transcriptional regulator [Longimicrobium sp.]|nr:sigma 54-interacting transcriptional regulator [Longimicrobium sp.]
MRLFVYDRQPARLGRVRSALREWQVQCVREPAELLDAVGVGEPCAVAVALEEPGGAVPVLETIAALKQCHCAPVCYAEGAHGWAVGVQCRPVLAGALQLLDSAEPGFADELAARVEQIRQAEERRLGDEARLHAVLRSLGVVGESPQLLDAYRWVMRASPLSDLPALLLGETGTGKELLARAIHQLDPRRRGGPFVAVNCAAISPGVAESELFGHRRGAYTGAQHDRRGLVRAAHGGVLFLDEVGELDESLQGKLLRVLQQGHVLAVGEDREVAVDVRVVAATNRDLEEMVRHGAFREDLYHRLHVLRVRVPPLRERPEDVAPLVRHFIDRHAGPCAARGATEAFLAALRQARLPGNVRQLENLVNGVLAGRDDDGPLDLPDLPPEILAELAERPAPPPPAEVPLPAAPVEMNAAHLLAAHGGNLARTLEHCEAQLVQAALAAAGGNQSRTARMLGITPRSVYNKIRKHHLGG